MKTFNIPYYWQNRYITGGNSGAGSYNEEAEYKAVITNHFMMVKNVQKILEIGSGDGNNLLLYNYENLEQYDGYDISDKAVLLCREKTALDTDNIYKFSTDLMDLNLNADLCICYDVMFHQVNDNDYLDLLDTLFIRNNSKYVILYTTDHLDDGHSSPHCRHRKVSDDFVNYPKWKLGQTIQGNVDTTKKFFIIYNSIFGNME